MGNYGSAGEFVGGLFGGLLALAITAGLIALCFYITYFIIRAGVRDGIKLANGNDLTNRNTAQDSRRAVEDRALVEAAKNAPRGPYEEAGRRQV